MIAFKSGVLLHGSRPEMLLVDMLVAEVFARHGVACVMTGGREGHRGTPSLHNCGTDEDPVCYAHDFRSVHITDLGLKNRILDDLKLALPHCDVLLHKVGAGEEHYHIEYDPKEDKLFQAKKAAWKRGEQVAW